MKSKKIVIILRTIVILLLSMGIILAVNNFNSMENTNITNIKNFNPEQLIRSHFILWNNKDTNGLSKTVSSNYKNVSWEMERLDYVKLISLEENISKSKPTIKTFNIEFEIKSKDGNGVSGWEDGKHPETITVEWNNKNSRWLITNWGQG